jgi:hypothetical protein
MLSKDVVVGFIKQLQGTFTTVQIKDIHSQYDYNIFPNPLPVFTS